MKNTIEHRWRSPADGTAFDRTVEARRGPPASMLAQEPPADPLKWLLLTAGTAFIGAFAYLVFMFLAVKFHWHLGHMLYFVSH